MRARGANGAENKLTEQSAPPETLSTARQEKLKVVNKQRREHSHTDHSHTHHSHTDRTVPTRPQTAQSRLDQREMSTVKRVVRFRLQRPSRRRTQETAGLVAGTGHPREACTTMGQDVAELDKGITVTTPEVTLRPRRTTARMERG